MIAGLGGARADDAVPSTPTARPADTDALFGRKPTPRAPARPADADALFGRTRKAPARCGDAHLLPCPRRDGAAPAALIATLERRYLQRLPVGDADVGAVAGYAAGVGRDDVGLVIGGATGLDTRWTVDGAPIDAPFTGGLGLAVPLAFVERVQVGTGGLGVDSAVGVGGLVDVTLRRAGDRTEADAHVWIGGGAAASWAERGRNAYVPVRGRLVGARTLSGDAVWSRPLPEVAGGASWVLIGVAPSLRDVGLDREVFRQVDDDDDGRPDRDGDGAVVHERVGGQVRPSLGYDVPLVARGGLDFAHHRVELTALANLARTTRWIVAAEDDAAGVERTSAQGSVGATWRGAWGATEVRVQGAWYRAQRDEAPRTTGGSAPAIGYAYVPAVDEGLPGDAEDQAIRAACSDGTGDPSPAIVNCPIATGFYWSGGAGALTDLTIDRPSVSADLVHTRGEHRLALGVSADDVRAVVTTSYSGGSQRRQLGPGAFFDYQYVELTGGPDTCAGLACRKVDAVALTYRTRTMAAYLADTWRPASSIAVEYGVRAQSSQLGTVLELRDVLPRASAAWDPLGGGRSRVFVSWGRYVAAVPAGLGAAVYDGPSLLQTLTLAGDTDETLGGRVGLAIDPHLDATRVDETLAGAEVGQADVVRLGVSARYRRLGRGLDDEAGVLATAGAITGARATRDYRELTAWIDSAPTSKLAARLGYAYSSLTGTWPGPYDPIDGAHLGASSLFDGGATAAYANTDGALPGDQPHRFFAELALRGRWHGVALDGGLRATATSGRPRSALIGREQVFVLPRGSLGRLPMVTQANVHLGARLGAAHVTLDVWNLFDRRGALAVDESFARDTTPIVGGDATDLLWLKDDVVPGAPALRIDSYGAVTRRQAPISAMLGVAVEL